MALNLECLGSQSAAPWLKSLLYQSRYHHLCFTPGICWPEARSVLVLSTADVGGTRGTDVFWMVLLMVFICFNTVCISNIDPQVNGPLRVLSFSTNAAITLKFPEVRSLGDPLRNDRFWSISLWSFLPPSWFTEYIKSDWNICATRPGGINSSYRQHGFPVGSRETESLKIS